MRYVPIVAAALIAVPTFTHGQNTRDSTISVSATKITRIAPDRASMFVLVEGSAETPADAVARAETKLKAVSDALKALGPRTEVDRAITYSVGPAPQPNMYPAPTLPTSNVSRAVLRVSVVGLDQLARVAAAALGAGSSGVSSIMFESSAADSVRRSRMTDALAQARADAAALAAALGGKLGELVEVTSNAGPLGFQGPTMLNFDARFSQPPQAPDVSISSSVTVRFRLVR